MEKSSSIKQFLEDQSKLVRIIQYILISLFLILIGLDIHLALDNEEKNTISQVIKNSDRSTYYALMYLWGAIASNIFLYSAKDSLFKGTLGFTIVLLIGVLLEIFNAKKYLGIYAEHQYSIFTYTLFMLFGMLMGWLFWRQKT